MPGAAPSGFDKVKLRGGGVPERRIASGSGANTPVRGHSRLRTENLAIKGNGERTPLLQNGGHESRSLD